MAKLTDKARALIDDPNFAYLATVGRDGVPQLTPVWIDRDGDTIRINTAKGRAKDRNMRRDPRVAVSIAAHGRSRTSGSRSAATWSGSSTSRRPGPTSTGSTASTTSSDEDYPVRPGEERVIFLIEPERVL